MKIKWEDSKTGEIFNEWELNPSQIRFWDSKKKFVLFSGGYGCCAGETRIYNADNGQEVPIKELHERGEAIRVLSIKNGRVVKAQAAVPVRYEKAPLFRVVTPGGKITVTAEHRFLTHGGWKRLSELEEHEPLLGYVPSPRDSILDISRSTLLLGVLHFVGTIRGFLSYYRSVFHFYGAQPLRVLGICLSVVPSQAYALGRSLVSSHADELPLSTHNRFYHVFSRPSKSGSSPSEKHHHGEGGEGRSAATTSGRIFETVRSEPLFLWNSFFRRIKERVFRSVRSHPYPTIGDNRILSITPIGSGHYYDMHVFGSHNYLAEGLFHHNCGKSLMLTLKAIDLALRYPNNYILMGRKTYPELRDTLLKEFFSICPDALIQNYLKAEGRVIFPNKSEIIFRHLDTMAESEIRSMNLGAAFIDQAEDISKEVFDGLRGRLRREGVPDEDKKIYLTCNPALTWLYAEFKQKENPDHEVIEASTLENEKNLPKGYIEDLLKYPEGYKRQYVYGIWDMSLLSEGTVFAREHIEKLMLHVQNPIQEREGLKIFKKFESGHKYQMGIDAAEGSEGGDNAVIVIADLDTLEEVASFSGKVPPDVLADKAEVFASWYSDKKRLITVVPEMNSIGLALVNRLRDSGERHFRLFLREEYDRVAQKTIEKVGWRTTRQSKPLLIARFQELLRLANPKIYSKETVEEFKSFVWTDEAKKQGAGAKGGFHDDRIIATLLAFWQKGTLIPGKVGVHKKQSDIMIRNGKLYIPQLMGPKPEVSWKAN